MPRPKQPEPLDKGRQIRLTARHAVIYQQLGGVVWLRQMLDKHAPLPKKYYDTRKESQERSSSFT